MTTALLEEPMHIKVRVSGGRVVEADLYQELSIDIGNIRQELINQPAKYATWAVLSDLAEQRLVRIEKELDGLGIGDERYLELLEKYSITKKQYEFLYQTREAFYHRKSALLELWSNPTRKEVLDDFEKTISNIRALLEDIVPFVSPENN
jgi:chromosome segregation ATPase